MRMGESMVKIAALGTRMMHTAAYEYERFAHNGYGGFRAELTNGEQNQGVYMHVLGNAGAVLLGENNELVLRIFRFHQGLFKLSQAPVPRIRTRS